MEKSFAKEFYIPVETDVRQLYPFKYPPCSGTYKDNTTLWVDADTWTDSEIWGEN
jgi:hypothetical protein